MPTLTRLQRADDICVSTWRDPRTNDMMTDILTPLTDRQRTGLLQGGTPPKPASVPASYVFVSARLERMFTNGRQEILSNEMGDVSGWNGLEKAGPLLRAVIQEVGDDPVQVMLTRSKYTELPNGRISTVAIVESDPREQDGKVMRYTITGDVAVKVGER